MKCIRKWLGVIGLVIGLAGCGGGDGTPPAELAVAPPGTVGAAGAVVEGPDGSRVDVPADAVQGPVQVTIAKDATLAPGLAADSGFRLVSNIYVITPHGRSFAKPVTVTLPVDGSRMLPQGQLVLLKAQPGGDWVVHTNVVQRGAEASIAVREFSVFALAQRVTEPFRFTVAVTGTKPDLKVTYQFSGQRPVCSRGLTVQTVFRYEYGYFVNYRTYGVLGGYTELDRRDTIMIDQQVIPVPGGLDGAAAGHPVTQPLLPSDPSLNAGEPWKPFVEGRVICAAEVLTSSGEGASFTPQTWTYRSENMPQIAAHTGPVAILQDIAEVQATVGVRSISAATVQVLRSSMGLGLEQFSYWQQSRDNGVTWARLSNADQASPDPAALPTLNTLTLAANGVFRLRTTLPELPVTDNGTLVRLSACIDVRTCALGSSRALSVSAAIAAPAFTREPASTVVVVGAGVTFTAAVSGTPPPGLQWQRASGGTWADIPGATGASYSIPTVTAGEDGTQFRVVATNSAGSLTSGAATLNVVDQATAPRVVAQSGSLTVIAGGSAVFAAQVTGTAPLSYQWRRNGTALTGANGPILRLDDVSDAQAGNYTLEVSNPAGAVVGSAQVLTVSAAPTAPLAAPAITTPPVAVSVTEGNGATFGVGVTGGAPMSFQWRRNAVDIPGATAATYTLPAVALADGGSYSVRVSNPSGSVVSAAASLSVSAAPATPPPPEPPTIVTQPGVVVVAPGMGATLAVTVAGTGPLTYEWLRNGAVVPGQTAAAYTVAAASQLDAGTYVVRVTNSVGTVSSSAGQLILLGAPSITAQPAPASSLEGSTASFSVAASGTALRYQWTRNNTAIPDATAASYTTPTLALTDNGAVYGVIVYNGAGLVIGQGTVLTVTASTTALAYEPFAYPVGSGLTNQVGGVGWTNAWTVLDPATYDPVEGALAGQVVAGLGYTDAAGNALVTGGGAWQTPNLGTSKAFRYTEAAFGAPGTSRWMSFLVRQPTQTSGQNHAVAGFGVRDAPTPMGGIGNPSLSAVSAVATTARFDNCCGSTGVPIPGWGAGSVALVLTRADFADAGNGTIQVWINPLLDPTQPLGPPTVQTSVTNVPDALLGVTLMWGDSRSFIFDELRVGTSRAAVSPYTYAPPGMVLFAGAFGEVNNVGNGDGTGTAARFNEARGVVADASGNLFVANRNGGWISKVTPGAVVTRIADHGFATSLAFGPDGSLLSIPFAGPGPTLRVLPPLQAGATTQARSCGDPICGYTVTPNRPFLAVAPDQKVYVSWQDANFISVTSGPLSTVNPPIAFFAGTTDLLNRPAGWVDGTGTDARFNAPSGIAFGPDGNLYVADTNNHVIRKITPATATTPAVVTTFAGTGTVAGSTDGALLSARFNYPYHIAFDSEGSLWVMDVGGPGAYRAGLRKIAGGQVTTPVADLQAEIDAVAGGPTSSAVINGFTRVYGGMAVIGPKRLAFTITHALLVLTLP